MFEFLRVTSAVPNVSVANVDYNVSQICEKIAEASDAQSNIVVFPELAVTGYTCGDLFFQDTLINSSNKGVEQIIETSSKYAIPVIVGAPIKIFGQLYNCALVIACGKICGIVPKTFIPNHSEFFEKRIFSSAEDLKLSEVNITDIGILKYGPYSIPIGNNIVFNVNNKYKFGIEVCEDLWTALPPSTFLSLAGAEVIFNISASNEVVSKRKYREELIKQQSARTFSNYVYTSAGSGESTSDLIFSGNTIIAENGKITAENDKIIDNNYCLSADFDLGKIRADRLKTKTFKDANRIYGDFVDVRTVNIVDNSLSTFSNGALLNISKHPFIPTCTSDRITACKEIFAMQVAGLKKRVEITNSKLVVGVSGGLDSTLALLVAVKVMSELNRPLEDVHGITMPCFGTSGRTYNNSIILMQTLGVTAKEINIKDACLKHFDDIGHDADIHDITYENSQARERTQVLMDYAGKIGGFVVGTGDLSELALGWCTYNGDHMSMYSVNCDIPKTLIKWIIDTVKNKVIFQNSATVLEDIINTPISPELLPPDEAGKIAQKTEDIVGPYELHDFFMYYILRYGFAPSKIYHLALTAFADVYSKETILKWLKNFYRRFFTQQFKRNCVPDGVKVGSIGLSPRGDWKMPSDASFKIWLDELETI